MPELPDIDPELLQAILYGIGVYLLGITLAGNKRVLNYVAQSMDDFKAICEKWAAGKPLKPVDAEMAKACGIATGLIRGAMILGASIVAAAIIGSLE